MSGTMLDAKISDMTKTGRSLSPQSQHSSGRDGGKLKDLVYYGRIIPPCGRQRHRWGTKNSGWGQTDLH